MADTASDVAAPWWFDCAWTKLPVVEQIQWTSHQGGTETPSSVRSQGSKRSHNSQTRAYTSKSNHAGNDGSPSFRDFVKTHRRRLSSLDRFIPYLETLLENLRTLHARLDRPYQRVRRVHMDRLINRVECRLQELKDKTDLEHFDARMQPYMVAQSLYEQERIGGHDDTEVLQRRMVVGSARMMSSHQQSRTRERMIQNAKSQMKYTAVHSDVGGHVIEDMMRRLYVEKIPSISGHGMDTTVRACDRSSTAPRPRATLADECSTCHIPLIKSTRDYILMCKQCGFCTTYLDATEAARAFGADVEWGSQPAYRMNHFIEHANTSQAKEEYCVAESKLRRVAALLYEWGVRENTEITVALVMRAGQKLSMPEVRKHASQVASRLSGIPPATMSREQLIIAKTMFHEIQRTFTRLFPTEPLVGHKLLLLVICHTMGWNHLFRNYPQLLGRDQMSRQENLLKQVFDELGWTYRPLRLG